MYYRISTLAIGAACMACVTGDFLGPTYPAPFDLTTNHSLFPAAWKQLSSTLNGFLNDPNTTLTGPPGLKNITFSIGMFSIHDPFATNTLQFHHTSAEVANSTVGLKKVDGNSIYRVASMTKLVTTYAGMLHLKPSDWDRPITDFVPFLAAYATVHPAQSDLVHNVERNRVTLAALAAQIAGTPRDVLPWTPSDFIADTAAQLQSYGLPTLNITDPVAVPPCLVAFVSNETCTDDQYAGGAAGRPPLFLPWTSPAYTDFGFMLLGLAIQKITAKPIDDVYHTSVFDPLRMTSSTSVVPNASQFGKYVIAGDVDSAGFTVASAPQVTVPSGGVFSSINDLAKMGTSILNFTLLDPDKTRKWMKPQSHTAMLEFSLGRPWEIYRYTHPKTGLITDIYTKLGDSGYYGGYIVLIPDFDAGFSIISASSLTERSLQTAFLADQVTEKVLPALKSEAEAEAKRNLAGTYVSEDKRLNTTLTLAIDPTGLPGLVITHFVSNGTDTLASGALGKSPVRLLHSISDLANGQIAFRTSSLKIPSGGLFTQQYNVNLDWLAGDSPTYGSVGVGLFIFDIDHSGDAVAVSPAAWRVKLVKK